MRDAGLVVQRAEGTFRYYRAERAVLDALRPLLDVDGSRWEPADDLPERELTKSGRRMLSVTSARLPVPQGDAFRGLTEAYLFTRWLGVDVTIEHGVLACEMEWGTKVRGRYEHLVEPELIHFSWDLADDAAPSPSQGLPAYVHITARGTRACEIEVRQVVDDEEQARFMSAAWGMVLGRMRAGIRAALKGGAATRPPRPKRRT